MNPAYATALRVLGILVLGALLVLFANYVGGALFLLAHKINPANHFPYSALDAWEHYQQFPQYTKSLKGSSLGGVAASAGLIYFGYTTVAGGKRSLHGQARYANPSEIRKAGLLSNAGIILGKLGKEYLILGGQQFVILAAPTRSGKGAGVVIPNLLTYDGSVVVLDVKKECWKFTAGYRAQHGQSVFLFDPFSATTHRQNPLSYISTDPLQRVSDASAIAMALYPDPPKGDPFWQQQARNLALGLILLLIESPELPCTIGEMARQATGKSKTLPDHLNHIIEERAAQGNPLSVACQDCLYRFMSNAENTLSSILSALNAPLSLWTNPLVDAATSASDFDWRQLRRKKMSVYIAVTPGKLAEASFLINIILTQLVNTNTDVLPEDDATLKVQTLLLFDEFTAFGKMPIFEKACGYMAGYNLRLLLVIQSVSQLKSVYGDDATKIFLDNSAAQIIFPPKDIKEAQMVSETMGYLGQHAASKGISRSAGGMQRGSSTSRSENTSEQRRALLLPQEVRELPQSTALIFAEYLRPIRATKIRWFEDDVFKGRTVPAPVLPALDVTGLIAAIEARNPHAGHGLVGEIDIAIEQTDAITNTTTQHSNEVGEVESETASGIVRTNPEGQPIALIQLDAIDANKVEAVPLRAMFPGDLSESDIEEIAESVFDCFVRAVVIEEDPSTSEHAGATTIAVGDASGELPIPAATSSSGLLALTRTPTPINLIQGL
jgi:type IV secretion system protein VirD4